MPARAKMLDALIGELLTQIDDAPVEIITDDGSASTGAKRNSLLRKATGQYVAFVDDDDSILPGYIAHILAALRERPDAVGFNGYITTNGRNQQEWKISRNFGYITEGGVHYRFNNHLSPMRRSIALAIGFPDKSYGEDYDFAVRLKESGLIKTEVYINKHLYHYKYITKK